MLFATLKNCKTKYVSVRFDANLQILLKTRIIKILHAKKYENAHWFSFLQAIED